MSRDIFDKDGLSITSFAGPGIKPGSHRVRFQLTLENCYRTYKPKELIKLLKSALKAAESYLK